MFVVRSHVAVFHFVVFRVHATSSSGTFFKNFTVFVRGKVRQETVLFLEFSRPTCDMDICD